MKRAYINIADRPDGSVDVRFVWADSTGRACRFDGDSHAHQLTGIVKRHLDEIMKPLAQRILATPDEEQPEPLDVETNEILDAVVREGTS